MRKAPGKRKADPASEPIAPLEHEEVVMVRPSLGEQTEGPTALAADPSKSETRTIETRGKSRSKTKVETTVLPLQNPALVSKSGVGEPPTHQAAPLISPVEIRTPLSVPAKTKQSRTSEANLVPEKLEPAREQTVFVEPPKIIAKSNPQNAEMKTANIRSENADSVISERQIPERESDRSYFTRTAQLIVGQAAAPEEARTILFQEIQEWVAAGASADVEIVPRIEETRPEAKETQEIVKTLEREPGVVRIREKHGEESAAVAAHRQSADIEEQNFDLSIGTISVVIEGNDRPVQPPAQSGSPQPATQNSRSNAGDRFSRLSRSYL